MRTLSQILVDVQSFTDLEAVLPTGDDLLVRVNYANLAILEAADKVVFNEFNRILEVNIGSGYQVSLPTDFRGFTTAPRQISNSTEYSEINSDDRFLKSSGELYCYVIGNPSQGYLATFNGLSANATISINYQRFPSGFATLTDICELPDDTYVVEKIKSYVLQSRTDERFPQIEANAQFKLNNMVGRQAKQPGGGQNRTPVAVKRYRMGT